MLNIPTIMSFGLYERIYLSSATWEIIDDNKFLALKVDHILPE